MSVMPLSGLNVVAQPFCDFVNIASFARVDGCERAAHGVGGDPSGTLRFHIFVEESAEIVPVPGAATADARRKAIVRIGGQPVLQECGERLGDWDRPLLAVLRIKWVEPGGGCHLWRYLMDREQAMSEVKPSWPGLHNLVASQALVESAEQDKLQVIALAVIDQFVAEIRTAEFLACDCDELWHLDFVEGIGLAQVGYVHGPTEERAGVCHVGLRAGFRHAGAQGGVEALGVCRRDLVEPDVARRLVKVGEELTGVCPGVAGELIAGLLVVEVALDLGLHQAAFVELRFFTNFPGFIDSLEKILSLKGDENALVITLLGEPVGLAPEVDSLGVAVCHTRIVTLARKETAKKCGLLGGKLEPRGVEPLTSSMPLRAGAMVLSHFGCHAWGLLWGRILAVSALMTGGGL